MPPRSRPELATSSNLLRAARDARGRPDIPASARAEVEQRRERTPFFGVLIWNALVLQRLGESPLVPAVDLLARFQNATVKARWPTAPVSSRATCPR